MRPLQTQLLSSMTAVIRIPKQSSVPVTITTNTRFSVVGIGANRQTFAAQADAGA
jgi:hypothetical protein